MYQLQRIWFFGTYLSIELRRYHQIFNIIWCTQWRPKSTRRKLKNTNRKRTLKDGHCEGTSVFTFFSSNYVFFTIMVFNKTMFLFLTLFHYNSKQREKNSWLWIYWKYINETRLNLHLHKKTSKGGYTLNQFLNSAKITWFWNKAWCIRS